MSFELAPMASHNVIGFVGLDQLSLQLASSLLRFGYAVQAFETCSPLLDEFANQGGIRCASPVEVGKDVVALVVLISPADQINDLLFGHESALKGLRKDAVIILHSTTLPAHIQKLEKRLTEDLERVFVVDIYVSKGMSEVLNGKIMIISSGQSDAITRARPILSAMSEKLYVFEGALGARSKIKMVIELLEGIHFVSSVEAISLGAQAGIHPWIIYDIISNAAGNSWVFKNHVPQLLRDNQTKHLLNTFVQNLGVVLDMAKSCTFPLPLLAVAFQQLIAGSSHGHGNDGDDTLIKVKGMITDFGDDMHCQFLEILRNLLDSYTSGSQRDTIIEIFYEKHLGQLIDVITSSCPPNSIDQSVSKSVGFGSAENEIRAKPEILLNICELLCFCVLHHLHRIKCDFLLHNVIDKVLFLTHRKEKYLVLAAVRFFRTLISRSDEHLMNHIVKNNLLKPIVEAFICNGNHYNLLNSAVLEFFEYIRKENLKVLLKYVVDSFWNQFVNFENLTAIHGLKVKYEQSLDNPGMKNSVNLLDTRKRIDERALDKEEEDYFNEDSLLICYSSGAVVMLLLLLRCYGDAAVMVFVTMSCCCVVVGCLLVVLMFGRVQDFLSNL